MKKTVEKQYLRTFVQITILFALWGFANDITNPLVSAFSTVMEISNASAAWVQCAFYGGYATMAIPAALFIRRYSYKSGILLGLALYAIGAFLFIPSAYFQQFSYFCVSLYVLTFGLALLETTANPYIMSLGDKATATRRLNLAQSFNPLGSLTGMVVAQSYILSRLECDTEIVRSIGFPNLGLADRLAIREHDLMVIRDPYVILGCVVVALLVMIALFVKNDGKRSEEGSAELSVKRSLRNLVGNKVYREGVIAQFFYVAAQIMNWTFIIQYAERLGIDKATAEGYNIGAMVLFLCGRFVSTYLMRFVNTAQLLVVYSVCATLCILGVIFIDGMAGLYCLVATSAFMSLMFPTIYGLALEGVDREDNSLGASFLVMAIVGGALMPLLQGRLIDFGIIAGMPAVNVSFILPLICFVAVGLYGYRVILAHHRN